MFPHYFGLDFSAALPWTLMGFLAGALFVALMRWLSGRGRQSEYMIQGLHDQLAGARIETSRLTSDMGHLQTALADAERRASASARYASESARFARSEAAARDELDNATSELARLRQDLATYNARGTSFEAEVQRLRAESASLKSSWDANAAQFARLKSELSEAQMKLRDFDLIRLKLNAAEGQLTGLPALQNELEKARAEAAALRTAKEERARTPLVDSKQSVAAELEIGRLRVELGEAKLQLRDVDLLKLQLQNAQSRASVLDALKEELARSKAQSATLESAMAHQASNPAAYSDALEAAQREISRLKTTIAYSSDNGAALEELRAELEKTKAALAAAGAAAPRPAQSGELPAEYRTAMIDLIATRNLSIVQAQELKQLRAEVERLTAEVERAAAEAQSGGRYAERRDFTNRPVAMPPFKIRGWRERIAAKRTT